jgi:hypothetical protein
MERALIRHEGYFLIGAWSLVWKFSSAEFKMNPDQ